MSKVQPTKPPRDPGVFIVNDLDEVGANGKQFVSDTVPHKETPNAFSHQLNLTVGQKLQIVFLSITLAPIRLFALGLVFGTLYILSNIGLIGTNPDDLETFPLKGWRRGLQDFCYSFSRLIFFCMGIHRIKVKGTQASPQEAPVLVVAPHATFVDSFAITLSRSTPVGKAEFKNFPIIGRIAQFLQVLFVKRERLESRKNALDLIKRHVENAQSDENRCLRQLLLFPEGTTTNGKALIHFKAGAFQSKVPVQPVILRFSNNPDTLTWTWDQSYGAFGCLWLTLCQWNTNAEMEFLPTYHPTEKDKENPIAFGKKVRDIMAEALNIPTVDRRLEDGKFAAISRDAMNIILDEDDILGELISTNGHSYVDIGEETTHL